MSQTMRTRVVYSLVGLLGCAGCSSELDAGNPGGNGGLGGASGAMASGGQATTSGMGGTIQAGKTNGGGPNGGGAGANVAGSAGAAGAAGAAGTAGTAGSGGVGVTADCAKHDYDLCIDFESGIDQTQWDGGTESAIITTDVAHGTHAYRLYPSSGALLKATSLGNITTQIWGRFYVHFKPGAPGGHGNIVAAFDQSNNWYEMGWQFDAMMGVWHDVSNAERPLRSKPFIEDLWYCVELFFDGTKTEMPKWWIDGKEAEYYMAANEQLKPKVVSKFERVEVGFTPYAGLGLQMPDGKGPKDDRVLSDMTIDDIAFDTERIGCITP